MAKTTPPKKSKIKKTPSKKVQNESGVVSPRVKKAGAATPISSQAKAVVCELVDKPEVISPEIVDENPMADGEPEEAELLALEAAEAEELEGWARSSTEDEEMPEPETKVVKRPSRKPPVVKSGPSSDSRGIVSSDPLTLYLAEVRKYPVLSREQEQILARKYFESKDPSIAQDLVRANLRFVVKVAAEYSRFGAKMIDLVQEGNVGLMHAVREFNPYKGVRLITYAVWWIRGYIQEYLMKQHSIVRIGTTHNQRKLFYRLQKEKESLDKYGSASGLALLSSNMGIPQDEVQSMVQRMNSKDISLDKPMDEDSRETLVDGQTRAGEVPIEDSLALAEDLERLKSRLAELRPELNERENILLEERLLSDEPLTLQEIGEKYGITREAVRQAEVRLMKKIKERFFAEKQEEDQ